ncbi:hypothetical protein A4R43_28890 [Amycolatopsis albispora]|uniref:Uncharacterized protein n=1 Tax=Amycolatopsis albispora TaxID=1804986 RepID=A0A344LLF2_9PSEU|nr:hypothetical protein A4R43_28890 [Amycolatopsis albispora]
MLAPASAALAITAHALADGQFPNLSLTVLLTALIGWVSTALADRTTGLPGILTVLGPAQLVMHFVLTELGGHATEHSGTGVISGTLPMTAAHTLAVLGTAVLLARAESLLRVVLASLRLLLPVSWTPAPVRGRAIRPVTVHPELSAGPVPVFLRTALGRRGPPLAT